ncbi:hypothetical protein Deba_1197 [Desulfarculus baarsii DSM 2075]|uniref:ABC transporter substrate-binding protein n=1 Tax=Desulfarculus baarsii (strain ATCC 33931 / DSM 2075 / LMG 7858 / VKM B-1802 / 2st14) TaxID=644282 RepID=E1QFV5_DESB2|nr:ABC transporter substrate-binding protein [Desulfarculus baarsii]ADK84565.1 hypothetical protein Deba_1197 [Desulfarculus baarsii DSM 2075]
MSTSYRVHLSVPPNIARHLRQEIAARFPGARIDGPPLHAEMHAFARGLAREEPPALAISPYPQLAASVLAAASGTFVPLARDVAPLAPELDALGLTPPAPELTLISVSPVALIANNRHLPELSDWADLCRPDLPAPLGCPPSDTPLPYLLEIFFSDRFGRAARPLLDTLDTQSNPLDINKRVDSGELAAGVILPALGRTFRLGGGRLVWPRSGALAIPMLACLSAQAPDEAHDIVAYLLSEQCQAFLSISGGLAPSRAGVPAFAELAACEWALIWPGWQTLLEVARIMDAAQGSTIDQREKGK